MAFSAWCPKISLIIVNFVFLLAGLGLLGVSLWVKFDSEASNILQVISNNDDNPLFDWMIYIFVIVGVVMVILALCGFIGALKEKRFLLGVYGFCLLAIITLQVAAIVIIIRNDEAMQETLELKMATQARYYVSGDPETNATTAAWYRMQYLFECCGGRTFRDYKYSVFHNETGLLVPETCCRLTNSDPIHPEVKDFDYCLREAKLGITYTELHTTGCYDAFINKINDNAFVVILCIAALLVFESLCVLCACCVCRHVAYAQLEQKEMREKGQYKPIPAKRTSKV